MKGMVGVGSAASGLWDVGLWEPRQATGAREVRGRLRVKAGSFTLRAGHKARRAAGRKLRVWSTYDTEIPHLLATSSSCSDPGQSQCWEIAACWSAAASSTSLHFRSLLTVAWAPENFFLRAFFSSPTSITLYLPRARV